MTTDNRKRVSINLPTATVMFIERDRPQIRYNKYTRRNYWTYSHREYESYPRVYVSADEPENMAENFINRTRRPYNEWRQPVKDALAAVGVTFEKMGWSKSAGCSMCPCSPGFILTNGAHEDFRHFDIWVTLKGAPDVDESIPVDYNRVEALGRL